MQFDELVNHLLKENWKKGTSKAPKGDSYDMARGGAPSRVDAASDGSGGRYRRTRPPSAPSKKTHGEMEEEPEEDAEKVDKDRMKCNSPRRTSGGSKKFVVKACKDGKEKIVRFGDPNMKIKKSNPKRRKSFRARHKCDQKKDKFSAGYWSCKKW
tara:strand:- start:50 stop:514 length:465 start_codon:yes stop_codon:yes gene_type:complete